MKKITVIILSVLMLSSFLVSCGDVGYTEEELFDTAKGLIEASYEINEIYFGEGLPAKDQTSISSALYAPVTDDCPYHSTSELKAAAQKVYTEDYCTILFKRGFEGTSLESEAKVVYARFIDDFDGSLTVRRDIGETALKVGRTYDFSTMKAEKMKKDEAVVTVTSLVDGKEDVSVTVTLKLESAGWRLDTPTY